MKNARKKELPSVYEPLVLNCDLLFAIADKLDISNDERKSIDGILKGVFLVGTYAKRYSFDLSWKVPTVQFNKNKITLPATLCTKNSQFKVVVSKGGKETAYSDWAVKEVKRTGEKMETFQVVLTSEKIEKQKWDIKNVVRVEIHDGENYEPTVIDFKVKNYKKGFLILPDKIEFKQVK